MKMALQDQSERVVQVARTKLLEALRANREKHVREYNEAVAGYKALALERLDKAHREVSRQDRLVLVEQVCVNLRVPRNFADKYDAAIDMAEWDVRETLELTHAEFQCFVRDVWEWTDEFIGISKLYSVKR